MKKLIRAKIQAVLARQRIAVLATDMPAQRLDKAKAIVERRMAGELNWRLRDIARRENLDYSTVYRALKGKPGWIPYGRSIRVADSLYRSWLTALVLGVSLDSLVGSSAPSATKV